MSNAADAVYDAADRLYGLASDIDTRGMAGVLDDLQSFARRRPGAFLLGAAVAGFGIGRAVRASSSGDDDEATDNGSGHAAVTGTRRAAATAPFPDTGSVPADRGGARVAIARAVRAR